MIGHEKLSLEIDRIFSPRQIQTIRFPKSGGVVDLDETAHQIIQAFQVRTYFYGPPSLPKSVTGLSGRMVALVGEMGLSPYSFQIGWETLHILRVGEGECPFCAISVRDVFCRGRDEVAGTRPQESGRTADTTNPHRKRRSFIRLTSWIISYPLPNSTHQSGSLRTSARRSTTQHRASTSCHRSR